MPPWGGWSRSLTAGSLSMSRSARDPRRPWRRNHWKRSRTLALSNLPELDDQYDLIVLCRCSLGEDLDYAVRRGGTPDEGLVWQFVAEMQAGFEQSGIASSFQVQALILRTRDGLP